MHKNNYIPQPRRLGLPSYATFVQYLKIKVAHCMNRRKMKKHLNTEEERII
jgi:hypothetical protein